VLGEAAGSRLQVGSGGAALADGGFDFEGVLPGEVELADEFLAGIGCGGWASSRGWQDPVRDQGQQRQPDEEQPDDDEQHFGHARTIARIERYRDRMPEDAHHRDGVENAALTSLITLHRPRMFRNSLNEYIVEIDGRRVGRLRSGASAQHEVSPGHHEIRVHLDTIMDPKIGYAGSPAFEVDLRGGERLELDVTAVPYASYQILGVRQMTDDTEGWLMLALAGVDKPARVRRPFTRGAWLRYMLNVVLFASLVATLFVFRSGSSAWWTSEMVFLVSGGALVYLRFGSRRRV